MSNPLLVIAVAAYNIARSLGDTVKMDTVQQWINDNSNRDNCSRGFTGNRLSHGSTNGFAELRLESTVGSVKIIASIYFNERQRAASQTWSAKQMDSKLKKLFGHNLRVRIDI